jgi:uncharacterized membrane protein (DUF485 family)
MRAGSLQAERDICRMGAERSFVRTRERRGGMGSKFVEKGPARGGPASREPAASSEAGPDASRWEGLEETREFRELMAARWRFVLPATIFFLAYYFALPILNGVAPDLMRTRVVGSVNIAYLFALSEFFMAWILAWLYIRRANTVFDRLAEAVRRRGGSSFRGGRR